MIKGHQRVALTNDLATQGLKDGDVGTVIHVHRGGEAFEVEFLTLHGGDGGDRDRRRLIHPSCDSTRHDPRSPRQATCITDRFCFHL